MSVASLHRKAAQPSDGKASDGKATDAQSRSGHQPSHQGRGQKRHFMVQLGRLGWFAKGIVYVLAGILAGSVAARAHGWATPVPNDEASPTGAIKEVATFSGGRVLLFALAFGLLLYAIWRAFTALGEGSAEPVALVKRVGYGVSAILYLTFSVTAVSLARNPKANPNGNTKVTDLTSNVMAHTAGRWLIGAIGLITIGAGLYRFVKGVTGDVEDELQLSGISNSRRKWIHQLGVIGEVGRGAAIGLIGFFLVRASMDTQPKEATGLDGALRRLAVQDSGSAFVAVVGVGFVAYGIFCLLTFTRRQLQAPQ